MLKVIAQKCEDCVKNDVCSLEEPFQESIELLSDMKLVELEKALEYVSLTLTLECNFYKEEKVKPTPPETIKVFEGFCFKKKIKK